MIEYDEESTFFSMPIRDSVLRTTQPYVIKMPRSIPVAARLRLSTVAREAIQKEADKMKLEEFEFDPKKD